jgi:hypothetical protein
VSDCPRAGKWFGCNFEPRYDLSPADCSQFGRIRGSVDALEPLRAKTYVRDVCTRCGRTIERKTEP